MGGPISCNRYSYTTIGIPERLTGNEGVGTKNILGMPIFSNIRLMQHNVHYYIHIAGNGTTNARYEQNSLGSVQVVRNADGGDNSEIV